MKLTSLFLIVVTISLFGCANDGTKENSSTSEKVMERDWPLVPADSVRIIALPTPMQIPALLRNTSSRYNRELLFEIDQTEKSFYKSNVLFGIYMFDLAYTGSFGDQQMALEYFDRCKELGDDMGLGTVIGDRFVDRFTANTSKPDSLGIIILEMYEMGHGYFKDNGKEGVGLLMIMGCLFEGMHLGFQQAREHDLILFVHLLSQQKQYAENLIYALDGYEIPAEVQHEYEQLVKIDQLFMKLDAPSAYEIKTGAKPTSDLNEDVLREIEEAVNSFRESIAI